MAMCLNLHVGLVCSIASSNTTSFSRVPNFWPEVCSPRNSHGRRFRFQGWQFLCVGVSGGYRALSYVGILWAAQPEAACLELKLWSEESQPFSTFIPMAQWIRILATLASCAAVRAVRPMLHADHRPSVPSFALLGKGDVGAAAASSLPAAIKPRP